jgi:uncharacterized protein (DUF885 family)
MRAIESKIFDFCWRQNPDIALEAGFIPPSLWEKVGRAGASEEAEQLLDEAEQSELGPHEKLAARYQLTCAAYTSEMPAISLLNHMTGPAARLSWASHSWPVAADKAGEGYVESLREFPSYCSAVIKAISAQGAPYACRSVLEAFIGQVAAIIDSGSGPEMLLLPLEDARTSSEAVRLPSADVVENVLSSLQRLKHAAGGALGSAHASSPLSRVPDGGLRYSRAIYFGTSLQVNPDSIQSLGTRLLEKSERRFRELLAAGGFGSQALPRSAELFQRFRSTYEELHRRLPAVVSALPKMECEVVPMPPANAAVGPPAYYGPSSLRNKRKGSLYVNTEEPSATRGWEILPLSMHEGVPGHHLQLALLDENEQIGHLNRWLSVNAFTEGWAVYAETLGTAMGLAISPEEEFGLLSHQRWRAARLVVEIGLHVHGWSVAEATAFIVRNSAQDETAARREVVRYLAWPGQALGYAVGSQAISHWVRKRRESGESLKSAHQELLGMGSIPLSVLVPQIEVDDFLQI